MNLVKTLLLLVIMTALASFFYPNSPNYFIDERDGEKYALVELNGLFWFKENLRYRSASHKDTLISEGKCGVFYLFEDAKHACPEGWRLPSEDEVKSLIKADKKGKMTLTDTLSIELCGRIDYEKHGKPGLQNTFWLNEELHEEHVNHWHTFSNENKIHSHNVIQARRKFPVRCVCKVD